jgi:NAD(P)-dependent dehydrogenase (short-subunit alcohol dehydrogenase family)
VALDLEKTEDIEASVAYVIQRLGRLDVLVNNAAQTAGSASLEIGQAEWQTVVQANLTGTFFMAQAAAREMSKRGGGRIINLSSTYAKSAVAARAPYAASKAGVEALTRSLALEWADYGINVNAIAPTTIATPGRAEMLSDERFVARRRSEIPLGRIGVPADLVATALLLAGPGGEFITGETIVVDGGFTLR